MDIVTTLPGTMKPVGAETGEPRYVVELPLLFTRIATGPSGILEVMVPKVEIEGAEFDVLGVPTIHGLRVANEGDAEARTLRGDQVRQRPVSLRPDDHGNNALVLAFEIVPSVPDQRELPSELPTGPCKVELSVYLVFTTLATLTFSLRGELAKRTGQLALDQPVRDTSPIVTNANLVVLCLVAVLLIAWNMWWNGDVYAQSSNLSQKTVAMLTGSFLTFVGLSLRRIKGWFATLTDIVGVLKYPELHLNPMLTRELSTRWFSIGLLAMTLVAGGLVGWNWSFETPRMSGLSFYDTEEGVIVPNERIGRLAMSEPRRFGWICSPKEGSSLRNPVVLAYVGEGRRTEEVRFEVEDRTAHAPNHLANPNKTGAEWLEDHDRAAERHEVMQAVLCGEEFSEPAIIHDLVVEPVATGDALRRKYVVSPQWIWETADIFEWLQDVRRDHLKALDFKQVFRHRQELLTRVLQSLEARLTEGDHSTQQSIVPIDSVLTLTRAHLAEIGAPNIEDKTIERSILLRALWRATGTRRDRPPDASELREIVGMVGDHLRDYRSWEMERVLYEFILELQAQNPGSMSSLAHETAIEPWDDLRDSDHRYPRLLDYLTAGATIGAVGDPQRRFLVDEWDRLVLWAGPDRALAELLVRRERGRGDPAIDTRMLEREVEKLARWIELRKAEKASPPEPRSSTSSSGQAPREPMEDDLIGVRGTVAERFAGQIRSESGLPR